MTLANEDTSGRLSTNEDVANKPRRITRAQQSTHGDVRSKPRRVHQDDISHKAPQLHCV